jgi:hypothetical protein
MVDENTILNPSGISKYLVELAKFSPVFVALFAQMCPNSGHYPL